MASQDLLVALLDVGNPSSFEELAKQLMSVDNSTRSQAEKIFEQCKEDPNKCTQQLVQLVRASKDMAVRKLSAVLLRRTLVGSDDGTWWAKLDPRVQEGIKTELTRLVTEESDDDLTRKICDTIGELGGLLITENQWTALIPFLFQCMQSNQERLHEAALQILAQLAEATTAPFVPHLTTLHQMFTQVISTSPNAQVKVNGVRAIVAFLDSLESDSHRSQFNVYMSPIVSSMGAMLQAGDEENVQEILQALIEIAEGHPTIMRKSLSELVNAMLTIAAAENLDDDTRRLAAEFLVSLTEAHEKAPGMMRKLNASTQFVNKFFLILMNFLLDIEDEPEWHARETDEEDSDSDKYQTAQECLDRIAINLGGKITLEAGSQVIQAFLADPDWKKRQAGLVAISQVAEGCAKLMKKNMASVITPCLTGLQDPHPRVRWAAVNCIGQLCTDLGPDLQKSEHERMLGAMMVVMEDFQNHRVQGHVASALVNFSESCPQKILAPYMDVLVGKLLQLLHRGKKMVQESTLTALASIADTAQDAFVKYYDSVMPYLKVILRDAKDKTHRMLRAKAMECISLIGMAVGKDRFCGDAREVMNLLIALQSEKDADDTTSGYMFQAWARLCKTLGQEFLPYMEIVMPPLFESAQSTAGVTVSDLSEIDEDDGDDDDVHHVNLGDKVLSIRTSALEEKATACSMLCCYADELKEGFYPYVEKSAEILVPLLTYFHEEVRKAAVSAMAELLQSAKTAVDKGMVASDPMWGKKVLDYIVNPLLDSIESEQDTELLSSKVEAVADICGIAGEMLSEEQVMKVLQSSNQILVASEGRREELRQRSQGVDFDDDDKEFMADEKEVEQTLCSNVCDTLSQLLKKYSTKMMPALDNFFTIFGKYCNAQADAEDRLLPLSLFTDVIEFANTDGVAGSRYMDTFMPLVLSGCMDEDTDLRQTCCYAVGVCAQHGGAKFDQFVPHALQTIVAVCNAPNAREGENESPTDNAISSLGKIAEFRVSVGDRRAVFAEWLRQMPLRGDIEEACIVHEQLTNLVERGETQLLGDKNENLPRIVALFADVMASRGHSALQLATDDTMRRMTQILSRIQGSLSPEVLAGVFEGLNAERRQALQSGMEAFSGASQ